MYADNKNQENSKVKKFIIKGTLATISLICSIQLFEIIKGDVNISFGNDYLYETISTDDYLVPIEMIEYSDKLSDNEKQTILNSKIMEGVLPYYNNKELKILKNKKLKDFSIEYFNEDINDSVEFKIGGFYDPLVPNKINVRNGTTDMSFGHEFIHLLQSSSNEFSFLTEPTAELMHHEFFGGEIKAYKGKVDNLRLLICAVGTEPILKANFSGDTSDIKKILQDNLDEDNYNKMIAYLSDPYLKLDDSYNMKKIIETLYLNRYGIEMKESLPGYDLIINQSYYKNVVDDRFYLNINDDRFYLNETIKERKISFDVKSEEFDIVMNNMGIECISVETINYYRKEITEQEYNLMQFDYNSKCEVKEILGENVHKIISVKMNKNNKSNSQDGTVSFSIIKDGKEIRISKEQAQREGYVKYIMLQDEKSVDLNDSSWTFDHQDKRVIGIIPQRVKNNDISFNSNQSVEEYADKLINAMENGALDKDGSIISSNNPDIVSKTKGYSNIVLLGIISFITSLLILVIGILYFISI